LNKNFFPYDYLLIAALASNVPALWTVRVGESSCCRLFPVYVVFALLSHNSSPLIGYSAC